MSETLRGYTRCRYGQMHFWEAAPAVSIAPTLILLHQNPSAAMEYDKLIVEMARDRRVIAFDTPGYGTSDPPPGPLSMADYAASFADAIAAMDLAANGPVDVFGFHTGSLLAAELGLALPEQVGRLVLSGIPMRDAADRAARLRDARETKGPTEDGAGILAKSAALWAYVVSNRTPGVPLARAAALYAEKNRTLDRGAWAYEGVWSYDYHRLPMITQPVLVLQPHDALLEVSRAACAMIPDSRFVDMPDLDRDIFELGVSQIANALRAFLTPNIGDDPVTISPLPMAQVSHSVLHPDFLAKQVSERYAIGNVDGFLLYRGMNDVYLIKQGDEKYALRVWRKTYRDVDDVAYEMAFLDHLRQRGFPASVGIPAKDGSLYFKLDSPEGPRALALYDWAPGKKFGDMLDEGIAERIGAGMADMHLLGLEWAGDHKFSSETAKDFLITVPALLDFVYDRPDDLRDYAIIAQRLADRLDEMQGEDIPLGVCHRDFHPSNVHVTDEGQITFLDFDAAGEDYLMQDVENFVWGNLFYGFSPGYGDAFKRGYQGVRPFTEAEKASSELFLMAKAFRLVAGMAHSSVSVGRGTLRFRNLDWLGDYIKSRARPLGLL